MNIYLEDSPMGNLVRRSIPELNPHIWEPNTNEPGVYFGQLEVPKQGTFIPLYKGPEGALIGDMSPASYLLQFLNSHGYPAKELKVLTLLERNYHAYMLHNGNKELAERYRKLKVYAYLAGANILSTPPRVLSGAVDNVMASNDRYIKGRLANANKATVDTDAFKGTLVTVKADNLMEDVAYHAIFTMVDPKESYLVMVQKDNFVYCMSNVWNTVNRVLGVHGSDFWNGHSFFINSLEDKRLFDTVKACFDTQKGR